MDLHQSDKPLTGKRVLIVDDDIRNIFALSAVLEEHDMVIVSADNGRDAIRILQRKSRHRYRAHGYHDAGNGWIGDHARDPPKSGTAKSPDRRRHRQGDEGGPRKVHRSRRWDYLSKPVNAEQMLSVLRAWLHR